MNDTNIDNNGFTGSEIFIAGTSVFLFLMIFFVSGILTIGIVTGLISSIGLGYVLLKMRSGKIGARVWNTIMENQAMADIVISFGFIFLLGTTTSTGIISGAVAAIASSAMITFGGKLLGKVEGVPSISFKRNKKPTECMA